MLNKWVQQLFREEEKNQHDIDEYWLFICVRVCVFVGVLFVYFSPLLYPFAFISFFLYVFVVCARLFFVVLNSISDCIPTKPNKNVQCSALHWIYDVDSTNRKIACWSNAIGFWVWIVSKINFIYVSFYRCFMLNDSEIVVVRHFVGLFIHRSHSFFSTTNTAVCRCRLHRRRLYRHFIVAGAAFCRTKNWLNCWNVPTQKWKWIDVNSNKPNLRMVC